MNSAGATCVAHGPVGFLVAENTPEVESTTFVVVIIHRQGTGHEPLTKWRVYLWLEVCSIVTLSVIEYLLVKSPQLFTASLCFNLLDAFYNSSHTSFHRILFFVIERNVKCLLNSSTPQNRWHANTTLKVVHPVAHRADL
jgi:hypothetical protein